MAATDHLNPRQFYHGTAVPLAPGDHVEPGHPPNYDTTVSEPGHVYFTDSPRHAEHYADHAWAMNASAGRAPAVYPVEPTGDYDNPYPHVYRSTSPLRIKDDA